MTYVVDTAHQVDALLARVDGAGATTVRPAAPADRGRYSDYFADLDGNPGQVARHTAVPR